MPTYVGLRPDDFAYMLDHLDELVVKTTDDAGGYGMLMGPSATRERDREPTASRCGETPRGYIAQPRIELSAHPTWLDRAFRSRRVDLRPFILYGDRVRVLPGGLTRVALREGSYVVNSSQGGGSKDTWVLGGARRLMLSRVADSLYWIGRYLERAENVSRLLLVTSETAVELEGLDEAQAQAEWDELLAAVVGGDHATALEFSREHGLSLPYVKQLLLDDTLASRGAARHRPRARERALDPRGADREVFENLNESHRELQRLRRRGLRGPVEAARRARGRPPQRAHHARLDRAHADAATRAGRS